jgi:hypothetical protein
MDKTKSISIGFSEWIAKKGIKPSCVDGMWLMPEDNNEFEDIKSRISTPDLYDIYLEHFSETPVEKEQPHDKIKEFLETLHFHGYIDHDVTKLGRLIEDYYPNKSSNTDTDVVHQNYCAIFYAIFDLDKYSRNRGIRKDFTVDTIRKWTKPTSLIEKEVVENILNRLNQNGVLTKKTSANGEESFYINRHINKHENE